MGTVDPTQMNIVLKRSDCEFSLTASLLFVVTILWQLGCSNRGSEVPNPKTPSSTASRSSVSQNGGLVPLTNMIFIKAGTFMRIKFPVTLTRDFWLNKYEVTQGEYAAATGKNPSHFAGDPNRPVEKLSYFDAAAYCSAMTQREHDIGRLPPGWEYRLPTEAEWEYACRAGTTNLFSFGDSATNADQYAWTLENSESITHPIGQKRPNPWGLYDMHGNVWEWCSDWFAPYPAGHVTDPGGPAQGKFKVFRGGGWNNAIEFARSANRFMMSPSNGIYFVGFRMALSKTHQ
ncbi:MAG: formylglycine-generating enzyme family protein [Verrucomicrobia bacterium]|nr:MAG: formylglycine-generating enzyme family protein [Verrucomicrobiota bacterium]